MPEKLEFSWEKQMPPKCVTCDSNRLISGILLQNDTLKPVSMDMTFTRDEKIWTRKMEVEE
jgi:hypothetical protein